MTNSAPCLADPATVRAWLPKALQAARAWHADAELTSASTTVLTQDGTANVWQYSFLSPGTSTCERIIIVGGGEPRAQDLGTCNPPKVIATDFIDSPDALKSALTAGFEPDYDSTDAYVTHMNDQAAPDRECWVLGSGNDIDRTTFVKHAWCVDPKTGKFVARLSGKTAVTKQ